MPRICYATGVGTRSGNTRSHSMRANKRTFKPNLVTKKIKLEDGSTVRVKLSAK
ncbi:50S ribosomal protein L28, partial [Candidatus Dojkabacteria bacterium]|nr:50S ribosomal protein L28 [Candidatus Dojkabacteria bacterium]